MVMRTWRHGLKTRTPYLGYGEKSPWEERSRTLRARPSRGWRIQALRAFRRADIIFDARLFESRVGGVAVAMTVASVFYFEFWFLWGVV